MGRGVGDEEGESSRGVGVSSRVSLAQELVHISKHRKAEWTLRPLMNTPDSRDGLKGTKDGATNCGLYEPLRSAGRAAKTLASE